jgi:possible secreted protein
MLLVGGTVTTAHAETENETKTETNTSVKPLSTEYRQRLENIRIIERIKKAESQEEKTALKTQKLNLILEQKKRKLKFVEEKPKEEVTPKVNNKEVSVKTTRSETTTPVRRQTVSQSRSYSTPQSITSGTLGKIALPQSTVAGNAYGHGWCTWGVKQVAPWVGNNWGNAYQWAASASAQGFQTGSTPKPGSVIVWSGNHVAYVTDVREDGMIQVVEANYAGNRYLANFRGWFNPNGIQGSVTYIYPKA